MSSISVLWRRAGEPPVEVLAEAMLRAQDACGPDERFLWHDRTIALGGNRMDLLPEDRFDRQPLWSADSSVCLVADLRLDNRGELALKLGLTEPELLADSAFLLEAWLRWRERCLDHIVGAFAFAVWTPGRQEIFAARDHVGERPLFYHRDKDQFALASVPAGLRVLPGLGTEPDELRIVDWMSLTMPDWRRSFYAGVERLPAGHLLRVTPDGLECRSYWHPRDAKPVRYKRDSDYAEALVELLARATAPRLRSTGAIGSQLSAGLDSSTVAAMAAAGLAADGRGLTAFTYVPQAGFLGKASAGRLADEGPAAAEVAAMYPNMEHVRVDLAGCDLLDAIKAWIDLSGEPTPNSVNVLWYSATLREAQKRGMKVLLAGNFGNQTISQEGRDNLERWFRRGRWIKAFRHANSLRNNGDMSFRASFLRATNGLLPMYARRLLDPATRSMHLNYSSLNLAMSARHRPADRAYLALYGGAPDLKTERKRFFEWFDAGAMNAATQAYAGIDYRDPTGDKRVYEFCLGIPPEQYAVGRQSRSLVRRAMRGRLPEATLKRYMRGQQGVDWYVTVREALPSFREELKLLEHSALARKFLDLPRLKQLLESWPESGYETREVFDSWHYALTRGIALGYFLRTLEAKG